MEVLKLENVSKKIGSRTIIDNLSLTVNEGEVYGFLGPNGAGKTTTIRMMVGLIKATKGTIRICGHDIHKERAKALTHVGTIVENPETYSYLTGRKNLIHYARLAGIPNMKQRIDEVVEIVDLKERINDKVKTYSLGMRQRLGVAQALLAKPKLLILDEPTNGLDPAGMREFRDLVRSLATTGMAVFVSSHLLAELQQICDRVAIIKDGKVITEQTVDKLLEQGVGKVQIQVDHAKVAYTLLKRENISAREMDEKTVEVETATEQIPQLIRLLVSENLNIYAVQPAKETLEEQFLKITQADVVAVGGA